MEQKIYATIKIDMNEIDEKLKAVIDAKEALNAAVYALEQATGLEGISVKLEKPVANDGQV